MNFIYSHQNEHRFSFQKFVQNVIIEFFIVENTGFIVSVNVATISSGLGWMEGANEYIECLKLNVLKDKDFSQFNQHSEMLDFCAYLKIKPNQITLEYPGTESGTAGHLYTTIYRRTCICVSYIDTSESGETLQMATSFHPYPYIQAKSRSWNQNKMKMTTEDEKKPEKYLNIWMWLHNEIIS